MRNFIRYSIIIPVFNEEAVMCERSSMQYDPMIQHILDYPFRVLIESTEEIVSYICLGEVVWHQLDTGYCATLLHENQWIQVFGNIFNDRKIVLKVTESQIRDLYQHSNDLFIVPGVRMIP